LTGNFQRLFKANTKGGENNMVYQTTKFGKRNYELHTSRYSSRATALRRAKQLRGLGYGAFVIARSKDGDFFDVYVTKEKRR